MLRALSVAVLLAAASPTFAVEATEDLSVAQQRPPAQQQQQAPKRDCEKSEEGVSA